MNNFSNGVRSFETIVGVLFGIFLSVLAIVAGIQSLIRLNKSKKTDLLDNTANSEQQIRKPAFSVITTILIWGLFVYGIYIIAGNINYSPDSGTYSESLEKITDNIMYYTHFCFFGVSAIIMMITGIYRHFKMAKHQALIPKAQLQEFLDEKKSNQIMVASGAVILFLTIILLIYNS